METSQQGLLPSLREAYSSNRILIKGIFTGILILLLMIPTLFINSLVYERAQRNRQVASEVSSKWSAPQTINGPYLFVPYKTYTKDKDGKSEESSNYYWITPDQLKVQATMEPHVRERSIYKVLLYRSDVKSQGNFIFQVPRDVDSNNIVWNEIKVCYGLSDFKGIEERVDMQVNGSNIEMSPGLPSVEIDERGLSSLVSLGAANIGTTIPFNINLKLKGSERLHFVPLAGNSTFTVSSTWPDPSFDGNSLPTERSVKDSGFNATWSFNKANLPFGTIIRDFKANDLNMNFGVTMVQPADQYAKTERSTKYAILFIGLTFALFFTVELLQKKPVHPVQYVLIGLALVIFYSLLLSLSEYIPFDYAYLISSFAIISMITLYAKSHFRQWRSALIFCGILTLLYGFIFVLVRLEDTALLVGSIGLFIVLALVMYFSRRINWYGTTGSQATTVQA
jgi:inner membrane protein